MTSSTVERLVGHYLGRLDEAARALPPDRREELLSEIREHIAASIAGGAGADEGAVRTMLDRLGEPAEIVAAATESSVPDSRAVEGSRRGRPQGIGLEIWAVVMLTLGSVIIPVVGWLVGVALLWSSGRWRRSEKLLGALIVPGGPGLALLLGAFPSRSCVSSSGQTADGMFTTTPEVCNGFALPKELGIAVLLFALIAPFVVNAVLLSRARARAALEAD